MVPILLIISIVLDSSKGIERIKGNNDDDQKKSTDSNESTLKRDANINWKRFEDYSEDLIKRFRYQGNILEVGLQ